MGTDQKEVRGQIRRYGNEDEWVTIESIQKEEDKAMVKARKRFDKRRKKIWREKANAGKSWVNVAVRLLFIGHMRH